MFRETLEGFKKFLLRGNIIDLSVGFVIGASFNALVQGLVKNLLTPLIAAIVKQPDFSKLSFTINGSQFMYGDFLNALISFLLTATAIYFFIIVPMNTLNARIAKREGAEQDEPDTKICPECLSTIPYRAKRCSHCGEPVEIVEVVA